ncbi:unnamed protein product [Lepeophtheirus salmonis]|uniref:(salmon louse) hypothetical protein n=1 Tax=Lepeophtheirus salmonis TaxID=72036 RepID=A0A7R8CXF8_LEPSM|nr:unnamed protein product [Lepeophtheirus salmonis]CAF2914883.1 unnamed protein product [Lepeophtheirus salmonis]
MEQGKAGMGEGSGEVIIPEDEDRSMSKGNNAEASLENTKEISQPNQTMTQGEKYTGTNFDVNAPSESGEITPYDNSIKESVNDHQSNKTKRKLNISPKQIMKLPPEPKKNKNCLCIRLNKRLVRILF